MAVSQPFFNVDLKGRVQNTYLPHSKPLMPLFEALVNSFQAIEERRIKAPEEEYYIKITLVYNGQQALLEEDREEARCIKSFIIEDNGIGFDDHNFNSFTTSDSLYKVSRGGKGVGRFLWLKEFEAVDIESVYQDANGSMKKRQFLFKLDVPYIEIIEHRDCNEKNRTIIQLNSLYPDYEGDFPKSLEKIAMKVVEHCLPFFLDEKCPTITITDTDGEEIDLKKLFNEKINVQENRVQFRIKDNVFSLLHVLIDETLLDKHKLYLMADNREVESISLDKYIVDLYRKIRINDKDYWYAGFLESAYLNKKVDSSRVQINIPKSDSGSIISRDQIIHTVCEAVKKHLTTILDDIKKEKMETIEKFVKNEAPQYRHLLTYKRDVVERQIHPGLSTEKIEDQLIDIKRQFDKEIKLDSEKVIRGLSNATILDEQAYADLFEDYVKKITDNSKSILAEYVTRRKVVLQLMDEAIKITNEGKYNKEKMVHELLFPMAETSDSLPYDKHNLWLIDERLAFHFFLSSDKQITDKGTTSDRPDLLILNSPIATIDTERGSRYDSIVIFEIKRPMRDDYTAADNPIEQLLNYMRKIRTGNAKDCDGRLISVSQNTRYCLYAICDITPSLEPIIGNRNLRPTPDGLGYYAFYDQSNAYIEVLPFTKLLNDSKKRNAVLFNKLGL